MAGKSCCGQTVLIGGGGGIGAVQVADTGTVDLEGDGSPGSPITANVIASADAGNAVTAGSDGGLFVPAAAAAAPVWDESAQIPLNGDLTTHAVNTTHLIPGAEFTAPEDGLYLVSMTMRAVVREDAETTGNHGPSLTAILQHNGATVLPAATVTSLDVTSSPQPLRLSTGGTAALTKRVELAAGDIIRVAFGWQSGPVSTPVPAIFQTATTLGYHKIAD